jgi:hypothetical protein
MCPRRWAFAYLQGVKEPFALSAAAGSEVHKRLEENNIVPGEMWGKYPVGDGAKLLQEATPPGILAREKKFDLEIDGVPFTGIVDGWGEDFLLDYKSTSRKQYVKTYKVLAEDPQRLLYVQVHEAAKETIWLYLPWADMKVIERRIEVDRVKDKERFKLRVLQPATEILALAEDTDPLSLPANTASCKLFPPAGCMFRDKCFPATKQVSFQMTSKLLNTLMASENEVPATPAVAAPAADAPTAEPAAGDFAIDLLLVDCIPLDGKFLSAHSLITAAAQSVAEDNGVVHARVIDYGKGNDQTAVQLAHNIQNSGKTIPVLFLDTRSAEGRAALQPLMGISRKVIRGV